MYNLLAGKFVKFHFVRYLYSAKELDVHRAASRGGFAVLVLPKNCHCVRAQHPTLGQMLVVKDVTNGVGVYYDNSTISLR